SRRRHTRLQGDWSSDVCSSDLFPDLTQVPGPGGRTSDFIHGKISLRPIDDEAFGGDCPDPLRVEYLEFARVEIARKPRLIVGIRSEERRVGKECRCGGRAGQ